MAIKIIKFDLQINSTKVTTLEALRDNLTNEIVPLARSGQLERWFKSRQMQELAQAVAAAVTQYTENKALFLALCAVLKVEVNLDDTSTIFFDDPTKPENITSEENLISSIINVKPDDTNPIFYTPPDSEEIENISFGMKSLSLNRTAEVIGMSVSNATTLVKDKAVSPQWITHREKIYLPLLHLFDDFEESDFQISPLEFFLNLTGKPVIKNYNLINPINTNDLIDYQGKILVLSLYTLNSRNYGQINHESIIGIKNLVVVNY